MRNKCDFIQIISISKVWPFLAWNCNLFSVAHSHTTTNMTVCAALSQWQIRWNELLPSGLLCSNYHRHQNNWRFTMTWEADWRYGIISTVPYEQQKIYRKIILFQRIYYFSISLTGLPCYREPSIVLMSMAIT